MLVIKSCNFVTSSHLLCADSGFSWSSSIPDSAVHTESGPSSFQEIAAIFGFEISPFIPDRYVHVGPSDYVPWLTDRKWCYIRMEGKSFGEVPLNLELKLEVWDSPNSAGVVIDAVRCAKIAKDRGISGPVTAPSSYFMKSPLIQYTDDEARQLVEDFISGEESAQG